MENIWPKENIRVFTKCVSGYGIFWMSSSSGLRKKKSKSIGSDEKETEPDPNNEVNKHVSLKMKVGNKRYTGK